MGERNLVANDSGSPFISQRTANGAFSANSGESAPLGTICRTLDTRTPDRQSERSECKGLLADPAELREVYRTEARGRFLKGGETIN